MKVFMTGATGFVGKHIAGRLAEDGHELKCLVRAPGSEETWFLEGLGAEIFVGDITIPESLVLAATDCDAFVHLVGIIFERRGAGFKQIHVEGTLNMLAAAKKAGVARFIHMSALGAGPGASSAYHQTKWLAEEAISISGLDYTIFRPSTIYGPGGEFINMLTAQVRRLPVVPVIGNGRYRMQPVSVFDVAACFSKCLEKADAAGKVYEIGGPQALSYNELIDIICHVMGKRRTKVHIPVALMRPVAWLSERMMPKPLLTTDQLNMLLVDNVCDITAMREELGVEPEGFATGLAGIFS